MFKKGDLIRTNSRFYVYDLLCFVLNQDWGENNLIQVWCIQHKTIYYLYSSWCDLL